MLGRRAGGIAGGTAPGAAAPAALHIALPHPSQPPGPADSAARTRGQPHLRGRHGRVWGLEKDEKTETQRDVGPKRENEGKRDGEREKEMNKEVQGDWESEGEKTREENLIH